jgi:type IV secretory pathway VirB4 component
MLNQGESPAEFFDYKYHPFADTYRLKTPYLGEQDRRFFKTALSLISTGKSFALCGPSGAGKSTLVHPDLMSIVTSLPWYITEVCSATGCSKP